MPIYGLKKVVWQDLSPYFLAGTANYGGAFPTAQFYKDPMTFVHLRGLISHTAGSGVSLLTMPAGYRPGALEIFSVLASYSGGQIGFRLDLSTTGVISTNSSSGTTPSGAYLSLDGITYAAEL